MKPANYSICVFAGQTYRTPLTFRQPAVGAQPGEPIVLDGAVFSWIIGDGAGAAALTLAPAISGSTVMLILTTEQTAALPLAARHELWVTWSDGARDPVIVGQISKIDSLGA